jgi:hypothetical protein
MAGIRLHTRTFIRDGKVAFIGSHVVEEVVEEKKS